MRSGSRILRGGVWVFWLGDAEIGIAWGLVSTGFSLLLAMGMGTCLWLTPGTHINNERKPAIGRGLVIIQIMNGVPAFGDGMGTCLWRRKKIGGADSLL